MENVIFEEENIRENIREITILETNVILIIENRPYIKNIINNEITILDLIKKTVSFELYEQIKNNVNEYFFLKNGSPVLPNLIIKPNNAACYINCYRKIRGGIGGIGDIGDAIASAFKPIIKPMITIGNIFVLIGMFIFWVLKFIWWTINFIIWLFTDLLNPIRFTSDFINSVLVIIIALFSSVFNTIIAVISISVNTVGNWIQGFWGWDQSSLTKNDKESNYFKGLDRKKNVKVYLTNSNTVPFSVILGTILCPPLGVFMDMGMTGWLNIVICILLTLLFYVPGLLYALLIVYS